MEINEIYENFWNDFENLKEMKNKIDDIEYEEQLQDLINYYNKKYNLNIEL